MLEEAAMPELQPDNPAPQREEEQDLDLLTYGEAGVRLHEEVAAQRRLVVDLEAAGNPGADKARARLEILEDAAQRNQRQPINDDNFERFFGYKGAAQRNT
jgi:hypothetical protein